MHGGAGPELLRILAGPDTSIARLLWSLRALLAIAATLVFASIHQLRERPTHATSALVALAMMGAGAWCLVAPRVWVPSLLVLPTVALLIAIMRMAAAGSPFAAWWMGATLGVCVSLHVGVLVAVVPCLAIILGSHRWGWLGTVPFGAAAIATAMWRSGAAFAQNLHALTSQSPVLVAGAALVLIVCVGVQVHQRTASAAQRVLSALICVGVSTLLATLWLSRSGGRVESWYLVVPLLALVLALGVHAPLSSVGPVEPRPHRFRWQQLALLLFAAWSLLSPTNAVAYRWSLDDATALADALQNERIGYLGLAGSARGPDASLLAAHLASAMPFAKFSVGAESLQFVLVATDELDARLAPPSLRRVSLGKGRVAILGPLEGRLRTDSFQLCVPCSQGECCAEGAVAPVQVLFRDGARSVLHRVPPAIGEALHPHLANLPRGAWLRFRLRIEGDINLGPSVVRFAPGTRLESLRGAGRILADDRVQLEGGDRGTLELRVPFDRERFGLSPPDCLEVEQRYERWLDALAWQG